MDDGSSGAPAEPAAAAAAASPGGRVTSMIGAMNMASQGTFSLSWTDEMHDLYLNSMEATFVRQLHTRNSLHTHSPPQGYNLRNSEATSATNDQFKVHRDGNWGNLYFQRDRPVENLTETRVLASSPWIQRFRSSALTSQKKLNSADGTGIAHVRSTNEFASSDTNQHVYCKHFIGSSTEVSDQNFSDGDSKAKTAEPSKRKRSRGHKSKSK